MILGKKVRIIPSIEQEQKLWQSVGTARFIYNRTLSRQEDICEECGCVIDRVYNASINLSRYELVV